MIASKRGDRYLVVWNRRYKGWALPGGKGEEEDTDTEDVTWMTKDELMKWGVPEWRKLYGEVCT